MPADPDDVAAAVLAHPAVLRLDGGAWGTVASYLPGRRLLGVRIGGPAEPVEIAVVVRFGTPLPELAEELAAVVRERVGAVPVDVLFADVRMPDGAHRPGGRLA